MNVREGFARLARVTAISYGAIAVIWVGGAALNGAKQPPETILWDVKHKAAPGWCFSVDTKTKAEAIAIVNQEVAANDGYHDPAQAPPADAPCLWLGQNFADRAKAINLESAFKEGGSAALWFALAYGLLWAVFRGVRWVALGFMQKPA